MRAERSSRLLLLARLSLHGLRSIHDYALAVWRKADAQGQSTSKQEYQFGLCLSGERQDFRYASRIRSIACQAAQGTGASIYNFYGLGVLFIMSVHQATFESSDFEVHMISDLTSCGFYFDLARSQNMTLLSNHANHYNGPPPRMKTGGRDRELIL